MNKLSSRFVILILILATGCMPMKETGIRVLNPAEVTLPLGLQQLAFINRAVIPRLLHPDSSDWTDEEFYILDTVMQNRIFEGLWQSLRESPLYDMDSFYVIRARRYDTTGILDPLSVSQLQYLKRIHPADAVVSLEFYDLIDSSRAYMVLVADNLSYQEFAIEAYLGLYTTALWRIYDLIQDTVIDKYVMRDTLEWYNTAETLESAVDGLPLAIDAIRAAAFNIGTIYGTRISPVWQDEFRYYHTGGGKEMRKAARRAAKDDWPGAAEIWKEVAYGENRRASARACFNMALVCEMEDLIIPALDWAVKSYSIRQETLTREYIDLLRERYGNRKKLDRQVPGGTG